VELFGVDVQVWQLLVGLVALVGPIGAGLWRWQRRPRLRLRFDADSQPVPATMYWNERFPRAKLSLIRLDVCNDGATAAKEVSVKVRHVRVPQDDRAVELLDHRQLRDMPLAWSSRDFLDPNALSPPEPVAANDSTQVDLIHVNEARPRELHLDVRPRVKPHDPQWLKVPKVLLELSVVADNHRTLHYEIDVALVAPWDGSEPVADLDVQGPRLVHHPNPAG
jgi:hypothetical protein